MYKSILQTKEWARLKEKYGQKPHWISDVLALEVKLPFKKKFLYMPEIDQVQLHDMDKSKLDELAKEAGAVFARVEIINPKEEEAGYLKDSLKGFEKSRDEVQPKNRRIIDIRKSEETILGQMKSKGRYNIRVAEKHNVEVKSFGAESAHRAENINHEMSFWGKSDDKKSNNKKQETRSVRDYTHSGQASSKQITNSKNQTNVIASPGGDPSGCHDDSQETKQSLSRGIASSTSTSPRNDNQDVVGMFYKLYRETIKREKITGRNIDYFYDLVDILGAKDRVKIFIAYYKGEPLAASIITFYDGVASYLYGGSSREHSNVMAPFAMHWAVIREAKRRGCHTYDLLGVAPEGDAKHKWAGLTRFKENFGGKTIEIIGSYDKVYDSKWYKIFRIMRKK